MAKSRSKELLLAADARAIAGATAFAVNWFVGRTGQPGEVITRASLWDRADFPVADYADRDAALAAARSARDARGRDEHGRVGLIYCVSASGLTIHVE